MAHYRQVSTAGLCNKTRETNMYELSIQTSFSAAHRLRNYQGDCEALHGHNWKVQVTVQSQTLNDIGLAIDFKTLKEITGETLDRIDHTCLNDIAPFSDINPSSENIARVLYEEMKTSLAAFGVSLLRISVWESDNAWASYFEG
jgi:6-pyruvoyltetrahydropterin/6-carboxytetrahydropterin synthase